MPSPDVSPARLRLLITVKKRAWCGELQTIVLGANGLAERGHDVILAHNVGSSSAGRVNRDLVRVEEIDFQRGFWRTPRYWGSMRHLRRIIRDNEIDVVEAHASWDHWLCAAALVGMRDRPPLVRFRHNRKDIDKHFANRWLYESTDRFLTQTERVRDDILVTGYVAEPVVTVLGSSVDLSRFGPDPAARVKTRADLGIPPDAHVIGYVGRLSERKRTDRLPAIHAMVAESRPDTRLVVIGWGDAEHARCLREAAEKDPRVLFLGQKRNVEAFYPAFDAFVLASYAESFPRAAIEAIACGVPSVTGPNSGLQAFVEDGVHGRVLADNSPASFAAALNSLWDDPAAAAEMAEQGRLLVNATLTVDAYVDRLERELIQVAGRTGTAPSSAPD